jgi:hypothetical protein
MSQTCDRQVVASPKEDSRIRKLLEEWKYLTMLLIHITELYMNLIGEKEPDVKLKPSLNFRSPINHDR